MKSKISNNTLYLIGSLIIGITCYSLILFLGLPESLNQFFLETHDLTIFTIIIFAVLYLAYSPNGLLGIFTSFTATLILFAGQLAGLWHNLVNGYNGVYTFSGLFPNNDASFYYVSSLRLLEGKTFNSVASWRPLSHGVIASLLGLTQQNLQLTISLLTLLTAMSCFFLAHEVKSTHGSASGVLVLIIMFMFLKPWIGTVGTENLGLAFGSMGMAMLWRGLNNQIIKWCLGGIFLLTIGLNIRAGTFFILPNLVIWGAWAFRYKSSLSFKFILGGFSVILLGFLINSFIFKLVSLPGSELNGNFAFVFYGVAVEGDWKSIFEDHPGITDSKTMYQLAFQAILADPFVLFRTFWRACKEFFKDGFLFSFIRSPHILILLQALSVFSFLNFYRQRKTLIPSFMLVGLLGILLSLPFVPPWDAGTRVYATIIPFLAIFPAFGLAFITQYFPTFYPKKTKQSQDISSLLAIVAVALVLLISIGTIITTILSSQPKFSQISCPTNTEAVYFRNSGGSSINLVADDAINKTYLPNVRISDFKHDNIPSSTVLNSPEFIKTGWHPFYKVLDSLTVDTRMMTKIALPNPNQETTSEQSIPSGDRIWIIARENLFPQKRGIVGACGKSVSVKFAVHNGTFFFADSMKLVK